MPVSSLHLRRTPRVAPRGFALVVALAMMTLIVLVIVASSLMVKVDIEGASHERSLAEARQNAMTGLHQALGELQTYAGPDQRVSARADLLNASANQPYWTGIWHSQPNSSGATPFERGTPVWLVSSQGSANPVTGPTASETVELVRSTTGGSESVIVEKVQLTGTGTEARGEFAYWVGDEGVKANIAASEPESYPSINAASAEQVRRLNAAHQAAWEGLAGASGRVTPAQAEKLDSLNALSLLSGYSVGTHFHDLTARSVSLLTNTLSGGIREDLTQILTPGFNASPAYADTAPLLPTATAPMNTPTWGQLRSFHEFGRTSGIADVLNPTLTIRPQSATQHGLFPIITMVKMNWHVRWVPNGGNPPTQVRFAAQPVITIANPYNVALTTGSLTFRIRYNGNPTLTLGIGSTTAPSQSVSVTLNSTVFNITSPHANMILLQSGAITLNPGESRILSLRPTTGDVLYVQDAATAARVHLTSGLNQLHSMTFGPAHSFAIAPGEVPWLRIEDGNVLVQLYAAGVLVQSIEHLFYSTTHLGNYMLDAADPAHVPGYIPNTMLLRSSARGLIAHGGTPHRADYASGARWISDYNMRVPTSQRDPAGAWISNPLFVGLWNAATEPDGYLVAANGANAYWGSDTQSGETHNVFYSIPRQNLISLGELQHANLSPTTWFPGYPFGNSWASPYFPPSDADFSYQLNSTFWDRYFFSALPGSISSWPARDNWLSPRLFPLTSFPEESGSLDHHRLGAHLGVRGGFNINSTSVSAWSALLKSLQGQVVPFLDVSTNAPSTESAGSSTPFLRSLPASGPSSSLWRGFLLLAEAEIDSLAQEIVNRIRAHGRPFLSLSEFVNRDLGAAEGSEENLRGTLQNAIDRTTINSARWAGTPSVPAAANRTQSGDASLVNLAYPEAFTGLRSTAAPGFLTQADLLTLLGPVVSARSDTFLIRAYGSSLNRSTNAVESEVWCEAIAQRIPEYVDSNDPAHVAPSAAVNQRFGRKFKIVSFRWLSRDEL